MQTGRPSDLIASRRHIVDVLFAPGEGAFFYDDQAAIRAGAKPERFLYAGAAVTPGFASIRMPAESLGIGLLLDDGQVAWGDMMAVQYSGAGGRDPLFDASAAQRLCAAQLAPRLLGREVLPFRRNGEELLGDQPVSLPIAVRYGVSQALLRAAAHAAGVTMAELICQEYGIALRAQRVPVYAQSGDSRDVNIDKMILKRVDALPHGLINSAEKFGPDGTRFRDFAHAVAARVRALGGAGYAPTLHFDVYGWIGLGYDTNPDRVAGFIATLADELAPLRLQLECPVDYGSREAQIDGYLQICSALSRMGSNARIVVDERCNTLDDIRAFAGSGAGRALMIHVKVPDVGPIGDSIMGVLACQAGGVGALFGGSCTETELSAQVSAHAAVATQADLMLAKPGMGVDEGLSIVRNEQSRLLAQLARRAPSSR